MKKVICTLCVLGLLSVGAAAQTSRSAEKTSKDMDRLTVYIDQQVDAAQQAQANEGDLVMMFLTSETLRSLQLMEVTKNVKRPVKGEYFMRNALNKQFSAALENISPVLQGEYRKQGLKVLGWVAFSFPFINSAKSSDIASYQKVDEIAGRIAATIESIPNEEARNLMWNFVDQRIYVFEGQAQTFAQIRSHVKNHLEENK